MNSSGKTIVVGIPTYKRPNGLEKLLEHLAECDFSGDVEVMVADNDKEDSAGLSCVKRMLAKGYRYPLSAFVVPENGISEARNALISKVLDREDVGLLCMLDDDEWPSERWLSELVATQKYTGADIVGGHVIRVFEVEMPPELMDYNTVRRRYSSSGPQRSIEATSNIAFSMAWLRKWKEPFFDPDFSKSGGGDKELLLRMRLAGAKFAWSNEAYVYESFPASRSTKEWALQRAYRVGNSEMRAYMKVKPPAYLLKEVVKISLAAVRWLLSYTVLSYSSVHRFRGAIALQRVKGKIGAVMGQRYLEYTKVHGN